jgi:hypothetical protein
VHDPDQYYFTGVIGTGSAFSIEPGIYVRENLIDVIADTPANRKLKEKIAATVKRYANIGVRIEDNYLVTPEGTEWASCGLPREIEEIEALMKEPSTGPAERDSARVEWYRSLATGAGPGTAAAVVPPPGCRPKMDCSARRPDEGRPPPIRCPLMTQRGNPDRPARSSRPAGDLTS